MQLSFNLGHLFSKVNHLRLTTYQNPCFLVTPMVPPLVLGQNLKIFQNVFFYAEIKYFYKNNVFDDCFKIWKGFKHFLNFLKFPCGPPLVV